MSTFAGSGMGGLLPKLPDSPFVAPRLATLRLTNPPLLGLWNFDPAHFRFEKVEAFGAYPLVAFPEWIV